MSKRIVFIRSGFIGDILVALPYIFFELSKRKLHFKDAFFITFQRSNINNELKAKPVVDSYKLIFGNEYNNSFCVKDYSINSLKKIIKKIKLQEDSCEYIYLPFVNETGNSIFKKKLFLFICGTPYKLINVKKPNKEYNSEYLSFFQTSKDFLEAMSLFRSYYLNENYTSENSIKLFKNSIVIYPNAQLLIKLWPQSQYIKLIKHILNFFDFNIILIGSKSDFEYNNEIINLIENDRVVNVAGNYGIQELVNYLKYSSLFIGNDGGPMHMAAIANIPIIALFSYKDKAGLWDPISSKSFVSLRSNVSCKLCNKLLCENNVCLKNILTDDVIFYFEKYISGTKMCEQVILSNLKASYSNYTNN